MDFSISAPAARMWPPPPNVAHNAAASTAPRLRTLIFVKSDETSLKRMASSSPAMLLRVSMMPSDSAITAPASRSIRRVTFAHVSLPWSSIRIVARARQPRRVLERPRGRVFVAEATGVGKKRDVEVDGDGGRDRVLEMVEHLHHHLADRGSFRLDHVDVAESRVRWMMVDVDDRRV